MSLDSEEIVEIDELGIAALHEPDVRQPRESIDRERE
jgi:hypothetical protein